MAIKKISEFVSGTPTSDSKILFEQNEKGKSCTVGDAVNTCSLTLEEIMATNPVPDLTNKVASANSVKSIKNMIVDIKGVPFYNYEQIGAGTNTEAYCKAWLNKIFTNHKDVLGCPIIARVNPNSEGIVIGYIYNYTLNFAGFVYIQYGYIYTFGYNGGEWYFRAL